MPTTVMRNWLREDGGPVFYGYSNRTSVTGDISMVACCLVFLTLYTAFLIIFPGIRKQRFTTFVTVSLSLFIGNVIMITKLGSSWHVGRTNIQSTYCALSKELINANLGVYIGLDHVNITLRVIPQDNSSIIEDINYNERFNWHGVHEMIEHYHDALVRGLPFPILTVAEYFSLSQEGFSWGSEYRAAGYYGTVLIWGAFASWLMMNLLLVVVPRYGAYAMMITASFLLSTCFVYYCMLPVNPLSIRFEENRILTFGFGWCFWLTLFSGIAAGTIGVIITCIDVIYPHRFSTVLEVDYDTPYDRHIIIEDSHYHRKKRSNKGNEESAGLGRRILRRLSSKKDENEEKLARMNGVENRGFERDPPNSPWRFAYHRPTLKDVAFKRTISQDSASSFASSSAMVTFVDHNKQPLSHLADRRESTKSFRGSSNVGPPTTTRVTVW